MPINRWVGVGRLARDPELTWSKGENPFAIARFTVVIDKISSKNSETKPNYIPCVAYRRTAEFIKEHFHQGDKICTEGSITTGSYVNKDGATVYTMNVTVDSVDFAGRRNSADTQQQQPMESDFMTASDADDYPFKGEGDA